MSCEAKAGCFTPKEIKTPSKELPGLAKTVFTHLSTVHSLLSDWMKVREKGAKICKAVSALELHECRDQFYPNELQPLMNNLITALDSLNNITEGIAIVNNQLKAVAKLQARCESEPVINTWSAAQISNGTDKLYESMQKEYDLKKTITENIAHCRDKNLIEVYVSAWELEAYLNIEPILYMFADVGISGIT